MADKLVMTHMISNIPNEDKSLYDNLPVPLYSSNMHMLVAKKQPKAIEIIERFNSGLRYLKSSGEYDKILSKHGFD